jgi:hypothetical protein
MPVGNSDQSLRACRRTDGSHCPYVQNVGAAVYLVVRQKGSRRLDLPVEFPLTDSESVVVIHDRRRLQDRRKTKYGRDDLKVILEKMAK